MALHNCLFEPEAGLCSIYKLARACLLVQFKLPAQHVPVNTIVLSLPPTVITGVFSLIVSNKYLAGCHSVVTC